MKTLIITAHPSKLGFTHRIASEYEKVKKEQGVEVEILDLYQDKNRQEYLTFENVRKIPEDPSVKRMQEKISASDELVFVFPLWWYGEPAVMKNFWDKNFAAQYAYRYEGNKPKGLLKHKTARVFFTSDGPGYYQWLLLQPIHNIWWLTRLRFCGIKMKSFTVFGVMRKRDEKSRLKLLRRVRRIGMGKCFVTL